MGQESDVRTARVSAAKAVQSAATPVTAATNAAQVARLNEFEIALAHLKVVAARINAAGGVTDTNAQAAINTVLSQL